jgi:hypothetical protein
MPALPINPYQVPQQHMQWQAAQMSWGSIQQQQQQVIQQPQAYNSWTPAILFFFDSWQNSLITSM